MNQMDGAARLANVMAEEETGGGRLLASRRLRPELREECAGLSSGRRTRGRRPGRGRSAMPCMDPAAMAAAQASATAAAMGGGGRRVEGGGGGGGPGAAAMGGRGRRED